VGIGLNRALGVFGGTFAPIHHGHLRLAIELVDRLQLAAVHLVPCGEPSHRVAPGIPAARRLAWTRLAVRDEPRLAVDAREVERDGPSYTYDTLASLRAERPDTPLVLMLGEDAANGFHTWHRWREIPELAHLVFVERPFEPPAPAPELAAFLRGRRAHQAGELHDRLAGLWLSVSIPPLAISSTRIRRLLAAERSIRGLVPEAVIADLTEEDVRLLTHEEDPAED
jgi:nicotinate-nucleotide adenylyltransferase (EC 2.7.7.18)